MIVPPTLEVGAFKDYRTQCRVAHCTGPSLGHAFNWQGGQRRCLFLLTFGIAPRLRARQPLILTLAAEICANLNHGRPAFHTDMPINKPTHLW